ncbi:MAG: ATP-dependent DNA helicase [Verrucomicrobia bacterium]|nr:ATP-dependent DNA helicase [Verrucomicrobiota bacterium]
MNLKPSAPIHDAREALQKHFGFRAFLDGQEEVIAGVLAGRDALVVMPTGGGKSLCYQLPAMVMDGVTIVISPLIALMKDQVDALQNKGIAATLINSTLSLDEQKERINGMRRGEFKLVYIAPERFRSGMFVDALRQVEVAFFAVDEAHCLSQWGHDFRPDYLRIGEALKKLGSPQVLALTATATPEVRADIFQHLQLRDPIYSVRGFSRPNLSLNITHCEKAKTKYDRLKDIIAQWKTGIIYCATRKKVEQVTAQLDEWRVKAIAYHGGLDEKQRELAQNKFLQRKSHIAVATNAFGMGIDRSDVRFVAHFDVPGSVEAYYQEAGRAGRDGEPAHCELFFNYADTKTQEFFIEGGNPSFETIRDIYQVLLSQADNAHEVHATIDDIADIAGVKNTMAVSSTLSMLGRQQIIERFDIPGKRMRGTRLLQPDMLARDLKIDRAALAEKDRRDRGKLKSMIELCYAAKCRQQIILEYFGEEDAAPCGNCDVCKRGGITVSARVGTSPEIDMLRKALSGVARMCRKEVDGTWTPRFGKGRIIAMLLGSKSREVVDAGLDQLTTYGLLKNIGNAGVHQLFKEMERLGLVEIVTEEDYPLLRITDSGAEIMRQGGAVKMQWPDAGPASKTTKRSTKSTTGAREMPTAELGFDEVLFEKLKKKRLDIAQRESVPAYVIFHNTTLEFLTRLKPATVEDGKDIRGIGEAKAEKYLAEFIEVIAEHR